MMKIGFIGMGIMGVCCKLIIPGRGCGHFLGPLTNQYPL